MAGIIGLLKLGGGLPPGNKSLSLDVGATARPEKDCKNEKMSHELRFRGPRDISETLPEPIYSAGESPEVASRSACSNRGPSRVAGGLPGSVVSQDMTRDHGYLNQCQLRDKFGASSCTLSHTYAASHNAAADRRLTTWRKPWQSCRAFFAQ